MADVHSKEIRSFNMSRIRNKNTKPEIYVRKFLYNNGFRYRIHYTKLPGKPDVVLVREKIIIDVKGCYWHRHKGCKYAYIPKSNKEFYERKFTDTIKRDLHNNENWINAGWRVIEVWECELKNTKKREKRLSDLLTEIN